MVDFLIAGHICRVIHRNGLSRKKLHHMALQLSGEHRGRFLAEALFYNASQFVWVDETGSDCRNRMRTFGYSLRGEPPVCHRLLHRGRRISAIAAMSTSSVVAYNLLQGSVNEGNSLSSYKENWYLKCCPTMMRIHSQYW